MAVVQKEVKAVLLLSPYKLLQDQLVIDILVIDRNSTKSPFSNKELISNELKQYFPAMEKEFRDSLLWFGEEGISFTRDGIKKKYAQQKAGIPFSDYYNSSIVRHMLELFQKIKPFAHTV